MIFYVELFLLFLMFVVQIQKSRESKRSSEYLKSNSFEDFNESENFAIDKEIRKAAVGKFGNQEIRLVTERKTWAEAFLKCEKNGLEIGEIRSIDMARMVGRLMLKNRPNAVESVWIGGHARNTPNGISWRWFSGDNINKVDELWKINEKKNDNERRCLLMDQHPFETPTFVKATCNRKREYICQKKIYDKPTLADIYQEEKEEKKEKDEKEEKEEKDSHQMTTSTTMSTKILTTTALISCPTLPTKSPEIVTTSTPTSTNSPDDADEYDYDSMDLIVNLTEPPTKKTTTNKPTSTNSLDDTDEYDYDSMDLTVNLTEQPTKKPPIKTPTSTNSPGVIDEYDYDSMDLTVNLAEPTTKKTTLTNSLGDTDDYDYDPMDLTVDLPKQPTKKPTTIKPTTIEPLLHTRLTINLGTERRTIVIPEPSVFINSKQKNTVSNNNLSQDKKISSFKLYYAFEGPIIKDSIQITPKNYIPTDNLIPIFAPRYHKYVPIQKTLLRPKIISQHANHLQVRQ